MIRSTTVCKARVVAYHDLGWDSPRTNARCTTMCGSARPRRPSWVRPRPLDPALPREGLAQLLGDRVRGALRGALDRGTARDLALGLRRALDDQADRIRRGDRDDDRNDDARHLVAARVDRSRAE